MADRAPHHGPDLLRRLVPPDPRPRHEAAADRPDEKPRRSVPRRAGAAARRTGAPRRAGAAARCLRLLSLCPSRCHHRPRAATWTPARHSEQRQPVGQHGSGRDRQGKPRAAQRVVRDQEGVDVVEPVQLRRQLPQVRRELVRLETPRRVLQHLRISRQGSHEGGGLGPRRGYRAPPPDPPPGPSSFPRTGAARSISARAHTARNTPGCRCSAISQAPDRSRDAARNAASRRRSARRRRRPPRAAPVA